MCVIVNSETDTEIHAALDQIERVKPVSHPPNSADSMFTHKHWIHHEDCRCIWLSQRLWAWERDRWKRDLKRVRDSLCGAAEFKELLILRKTIWNSIWNENSSDEQIFLSIPHFIRPASWNYVMEQHTHTQVTVHINRMHTFRIS